MTPSLGTRLARSSCAPIELKITKNPCTTWYKDVWGKKNHMTVVVELVGKLNPKARFNVYSTLYFESGKPVSEEWQSILTVDNNRNGTNCPMQIDAQNRTLEIRFRIEKVSTSFMSQKFLLQIRAVPIISNALDLSEPGAGQTLVAFSSPIESKAKPKRCHVRHEKKGPKRAGGLACGSTPKRRRRGVREYEDALDTATRLLEQTQARLASSEKTLELVVGRLEACVAQLNRMESRQSLPARTALCRFGSETSMKGFQFDMKPTAASDLARLEYASSLIRLNSAEVDIPVVPLTRLTSKDWPSVWPVKDEDPADVPNLDTVNRNPIADVDHSATKGDN